jgi:UDPglucose--hexose-1-phosphate uridylyltransferase
VPELRTDWLTGRTVLIAENRALRPNDFVGEAAGEKLASAAGKFAIKSTLPTCPFCAGNESRTPPAVYEKLDDHGRWQVRVVPNMYAGVETDGPSVDPIPTESANDIFQAVPAVGAHEVIIECPNHIDRMSALSKSELRSVLEAYAERLSHWRKDGRYRYGLIFKNQGPRAGASIAHLHSQLIALPFVPSEVEAENRRAAEAYSQQRSCPFCKLLAHERSEATRVVADRDGFLAFCPFASWQPHEVWLMPIAHRPAFEWTAPNELDRLTDVLLAVIARLESIIPDAAYNMLLRTALWFSGCDDWSHWRIELLPRINAFAGLEVATGIHINSMAPEHSALQLRLE